jgi:hypothetical protein
MARITPLEPPFTADVAAQLAAMMPPGQPPIGLFRTAGSTDAWRTGIGAMERCG